MDEQERARVNGLTAYDEHLLSEVEARLTLYHQRQGDVAQQQKRMVDAAIEGKPWRQQRGVVEATAEELGRLQRQFAWDAERLLALVKRLAGAADGQGE